MLAKSRKMMIDFISSAPEIAACEGHFPEKRYITVYSKSRKISTKYILGTPAIHPLDLSVCIQK